MRRAPENEEARLRHAEMLLHLGRADESLAGVMGVLSANPMSMLAADLLVRLQESLGLRKQREVRLATHDSRHPRPAPNAVIAALEADPSSYPGSTARELGELLHALVRVLRPACVAEVGTLFGSSALWIAQALEDNGSGHLHCFDIFQDPNYRSPLPGVEGTLADIVRGHLEAAGLAHRATLHEGDSSTCVRRAFPDETGVFDLVFIDGDHSLKGCLRDWQAFEKRLAPGALILMHDTSPEFSGWLGPKRVLEMARHSPKGSYQCLDLETPDKFGLALVQVNGGGDSHEWRVSLAEQLAEWFHHRRLSGGGR